MSGGIRQSVSTRRGWGLVFVGGVVMALLAAYPVLERGLWWLFTSLVVRVWGLPYVAGVVCGLALLAAAVAGVRLWMGRG